ncbi:hypothetical protein KDJ21_002675 [Metabacillus litoralis]|uniref:hypothetical protein n=1 Tax=Metabacillus litoralis TaxID=152268 RepID=UPI001E40DC8A|nr:hypothetical protein [Metabacillus litoralis]UHA60655.1 hypothetical protein KDJ21_002675 [Metabacillus litoralis]
MRKKLLKDSSKILGKAHATRENFISQILTATSVLKEVQVPTVIDYLQSRVTDLRERKILNMNTIESRSHFWEIGSFRNDNTEGHMQNIVSCFIKDTMFKEDNEIRVMALPVKTYNNPDDHILKSSYDINKLKYISVSTNYPNRGEAMEELQYLLASLNHHHIKVI